MRGHEANTSLLNDNLAKKQTLRTEKLQATGLMTRRHMSLEECLSHISKGRAEFCNSL